MAFKGRERSLFPSTIEAIVPIEVVESLSYFRILISWGLVSLNGSLVPLNLLDIFFIIGIENFNDRLFGMKAIQNHVAV